MTFRNAEDSHAHSLETLNQLYEYDDFMLSIKNVLDLGCGDGLDMLWWASRATRDEKPEPLNIRCHGIGLDKSCGIIHKHRNITYQQQDFEQLELKEQYDILWCHDAFQYAVNPIGTLARWWELATPGAMLALILPQTTNVVQRELEFEQPSGCYYHHTLVSLIHMLALTGWDCRQGFFLKQPTDPWLHAVVYKSEHQPRDPKTTTWYELSDLNLLPESADRSVQAHGFLKQKDLILPWLDKSMMRMVYQ